MREKMMKNKKKNKKILVIQLLCFKKIIKINKIKVHELLKV